MGAVPRSIQRISHCLLFSHRIWSYPAIGFILTGLDGLRRTRGDAMELGFILIFFVYALAWGAIFLLPIIESRQISGAIQCAGPNAINDNFRGAHLRTVVSASLPKPEHPRQPQSNNLDRSSYWVLQEQRTNSSMKLAIQPFAIVRRISEQS